MRRSVLALTFVGAFAPLRAQGRPEVLRADSLFRSQQWPAAASAYQALVAGPDSVRPVFWLRLGNALHAQQRWQDAEVAFTRAARIARAPQMLNMRATAWFNTAAARARLGRADAAFVALDSALATKLITVKSMDEDADLAPLRTNPNWSARRESARLVLFPCDTIPKARELDFWVGTWDVFAPDKSFAGTNVIEKAVGNCLLIENWESSTPNGGGGKSFNWYNARAGYWQQTWVGLDGSTEYRQGRREGSTLRFVAESTDSKGVTSLTRLSFTELGPNRVKQHGETSPDGGKTWTTQFELYYLRRGSGERP